MITVIAGVNGAGKSSVVGSYIRNTGAEYFNPDEVCRELMKDAPKLSQGEANARAWQMGYDQLNRAIDNDLPYTFETTLGGNSVAEKLHEAIDKGVAVRIFFVGLSSPELHIERVKYRVSRGGHDIPEEKIRERWDGAIYNLITLIPRCSAVVVYDNSTPFREDGKTAAVCLFSLNGNVFVQLPIRDMPEWAKPLASTAMERVAKSQDNWR